MDPRILPRSNATASSRSITQGFYSPKGDLIVDMSVASKTDVPCYPAHPFIPSIFQQTTDWFGRAKAALLDNLPCQKGCHHCCIGVFPITVLDQRELQHGLRTLPLSRRLAIQQAASDQVAAMTRSILDLWMIAFSINGLTRTSIALPNNTATSLAPRCRRTEAAASISIGRSPVARWAFRPKLTAEWTAPVPCKRPCLLFACRLPYARKKIHWQKPKQQGSRPCAGRQPPTERRCSFRSPFYREMDKNRRPRQRVFAVLRYLPLGCGSACSSAG